VKTDAELLEALASGDRRAWGAFLDRYEGLIYSVPRRYGLSADDAEDVLQDVLVALLQGLSRLRDAQALPRWLTQTAYRLSRDRRARGKREVAVENAAFWDAQVDPMPEPSVWLAQLEAAAVVRTRIEALPPRCRELLSALFLEDPAPSYATLGRRLGLPVGSLGPTRQRCLDRLLADLSELGIKPPPQPTLREEAKPRPVTARRNS
jgi:RNA polymerase sigma factor (sigma-70 family)